MKRILLVLVIILAVIVFVCRKHCAYNYRGLQNLRRCSKLKSGIPMQDLLQQLGKPVYAEDDIRTTTMLFETPVIMAERIKVVIDKKTNLAICIQCTKDSECR